MKSNQRRKVKKLITVMIDGKQVRVETPEHQNARMLTALERFNKNEKSN